MSKLSLSYDNPVIAVLLRTLAWELHVAGNQPRVRDVTEQLQTVRKELGLPAYQGGRPQDFVQRLRDAPNQLLSGAGTPPKPLDKGWSTEWRLHCLPPHGIIRQLSVNPVVVPQPFTTQATPHSEFCVTLRDPAVPTMHVFVGTGMPPSKTFTPHRGLYFLRFTDSLYVGKTDEFDVRLSHHWKRSPLWWVFISPKDSEHLAQDTLAVAEALLISFWNEVAVVSNGNRGGDRRPYFTYLQQGVLLVEGASAVLLWLMRDSKDPNLVGQDIPFKKQGGKGWSAKYMMPPTGT